MIKHALVIILLFGGACTSISSNCLNDKDFKRFDSTLTKGIFDDTIMARFFNDPGYLLPLRKQLCQHVKDYRRITYFEMFSPVLNGERTGVIYLHNSKQFFSFSQRKHNARLVFNEEVDKQDFLYKLMMKFENDFKWDAERFKNAYTEAKVTDAPGIKCVQVIDSKASSFFIAYDPSGVMNRK